MSPAWQYLAWRSLPVVLVLAWFLLLIGGFSFAGLIHLILLGALAVFAYQTVSDSTSSWRQVARWSGVRPSVSSGTVGCSRSASVSTSPPPDRGRGP